ncbi:hypothetical protein VB618_11005 [Microvirga sp. CF3062]|uniref:hypothetical protein n=1 Tax=Microvirga sp. CF3062 TaxID=3110182 RepID=UPI002E78DE1C|nr:hypothetical protein [Microvirga sp. CF3062]MEE1656727.1 hypothetical protein [Microvirga sp. CF3062]
MSSSPQSRNDFAFPWSADDQSRNELIERLEQVYRLCHLRWKILEQYGEAARPVLRCIGKTLDQTALATALIVLPKVFAEWDRLRPILISNARTLLPFVPLVKTAEDEALEQDPIWQLLGEFKVLAPDHQDKAAKNLALLWGHFEDTFGGLSGFLAEEQTEQALYLDKLDTASRRMKLAQGSNVAFHYVTVEVMRLYVICLQTRRSDRAALSLATCAATLINRGRMMTPAITHQATAA